MVKAASLFYRDCSWYLSWLTASITFVLMFAYGMWYGLVYRRAGVTAVLAIVAAALLAGGFATIRRLAV